MASGYPERFAKAALGHNSSAVHHAYARNATVTAPSLEQFERGLADKVLPIPSIVQNIASAPKPATGERAQG